ncbi:hypothetical protein N9L68_01460 [bacterium]|nr:hypothetical protein [bacterium]
MGQPSRRPTLPRVHLVFTGARVNFEWFPRPMAQPDLPRRAPSGRVDSQALLSAFLKCQAECSPDEKYRLRNCAVLTAPGRIPLSSMDEPPSLNAYLRPSLCANVPTMRRTNWIIPDITPHHIPPRPFPVH